MDYKRLRYRAGIGRYIPKRLHPVLLYHHIGSNSRPSRSYLEPELFEEHLRHLRDGGIHSGRRGAEAKDQIFSGVTAALPGPAITKGVDYRLVGDFGQ